MKHRKLNEYGLPIDARDWTAADWQDLHEALLAVYAKISARHKDQGAGSVHSDAAECAGEKPPGRESPEARSA